MHTFSNNIKHNKYVLHILDGWYLVDTYEISYDMAKHEFKIILFIC